MPRKTTKRPWHEQARHLTPDAFYNQIRTWTDANLNAAQADAHHLPQEHREYLQAEHAHRHRNDHRDPWATVTTLYSPQAWTTHLKTWTLTRLQQGQAHLNRLPDEYAHALKAQYQYRRDHPWIKDHA